MERLWKVCGSVLAVFTVATLVAVTSGAVMAMAHDRDSGISMGSAGGDMMVAPAFLAGNAQGDNGR